MSDNFKFVQAQAFTLAGAGAILGDTEIVLSSFEGIDGDLLTMSDFGTKGFATIEPNTSTQEEQISFTGVTQNANGTATLTGVSNVLFVSPYTETSGLTKTHAGGVKLVITNTSGFYNVFANKNDDETITQTWTFTNPNYPRMDNVFVDPTEPEQLVTKAYADGLTFAGAPNASTSVQGLVQEATVSELNAGTGTGSTGALLFGSPADFAASIYGLQLPSSGQKSALAGDNGTPGSGNTYMTQTGYQIGGEIYGADSVGTDAYAITVSPAISAYTAGMRFFVKIGTSNTGGATLQVGSGSAVAIKKNFNQALVTGDLLAGQIIQVVYDSANTCWQMVSPNNVVSTMNCGVATRSSAGSVTIAHGLGVVPKLVTITAYSTDTIIGGPVISQGSYNGTNTACVYWGQAGGGGTSPVVSTDTTNVIHIETDGSPVVTLVATVTVDATNINLTFTAGAGGASSIAYNWTAQA